MMLTETITLEIEAGAARFYREAPEVDRRKLQALFGDWLKHYSEADVESLKGTMDKLSERARARGLTPEVLDSILADKL